MHGIKKASAFFVFGIWLAVLSAWLPVESCASDLSTPDSTLYPYRNSLEIQDDFMPQNAGTTSVGSLGWVVGGGTTAGIDTVLNRPGLIQRSTTAVITTNTFTVLGQNGNNINPDSSHSVLWVTQLTTNDANTTYRMGIANSPVNPPNSGIYIEKLDADTNWFCVTRSGGVQTRTDSAVAVTTSYATHAYTRNSSGVQFSINNVNVCGVHTTNIPTIAAPQQAFLEIINSAAAAKIINIDYFQLKITGLVR